MTTQPTDDQIRESYTIYRAPGWHGEPSDPVIGRTDDEREAAMRAGCRVDIKMPGQCNRYDAYAVDDDTGERLEAIPSFRCDHCGELIRWGNYGPTGVYEGRVLECAGGMDKHLVDWVCDDCVDVIEEE